MTKLHKIKKIIKSHFIENGTIPDVDISLNRLKNLGFEPSIVFDVGAYKGDFAKKIMKIWSNSNVYCFEALPDKIKELKNLGSNYAGIKVIEGIVGNENLSDVTFNMAETASSVLKENEDQNFPVHVTKMHRLSTLIENKRIPIPDLLKIDTQGFEFQVLKGIEDHFSDIKLILAEINFIDIHKDVVLISDILTYLKGHNFVPYDITEIHRRPLDKAINQIDMIFVKEDSYLRQDKRWKD